MLPKITHPLFDIVIPSTGQRVKFRPFTVREEKLLLMAREANTPAAIIDTYKNIISNCVNDPNFDVESLAMFDIEYFFLKLRAKSVSEISTIIVTDPDDGESYTIDVNLNDVEVQRPENHKQTFMLNETLGLKMKYPTFAAVQAFEEASANATSDEVAIQQGSFATIRACMDILFVEGTDAVYKLSEYSAAEVDQMLSDMTADQLRPIRDFMETMPRVEHKVKYVRKDGTERELTLSGLMSFF